MECAERVPGSSIGELCSLPKKRYLEKLDAF